MFTALAAVQTDPDSNKLKKEMPQREKLRLATHFYPKVSEQKRCLQLPVRVSPLQAGQNARLTGQCRKAILPFSKAEKSSRTQPILR